MQVMKTAAQHQYRKFQKHIVRPVVRQHRCNAACVYFLLSTSRPFATCFCTYFGLRYRLSTIHHCPTESTISSYTKYFVQKNNVTLHDGKAVCILYMEEQPVKSFGL